MNKTKQEKDYILHETRDRRLFPHVPDPNGMRSNVSRRDDHLQDKRPAYAEYAGVRYESEVDVTINTSKKRMRAKSVNISQTGMLLRLAEGFVLKISTGIRRSNLTSGLRKETSRRERKNTTGIFLPRWFVFRRTKLQ